MSEKKKFLLRLDPGLYAAMEKWAADELRSVNAQIEFLLQEAARRAERLKRSGPADPGSVVGTGFKPVPTPEPARISEPVPAPESSPIPDPAPAPAPAPASDADPASPPDLAPPDMERT